MSRTVRYLTVFLALIAFASGLAFAQSGTTGAIEGKVTDDGGAALPGAEVKISSPDLIGGIQSKLTNAEGRFRFVATAPRDLRHRGVAGRLHARSSGTTSGSSSARPSPSTSPSRSASSRRRSPSRGRSPLVDVKDSQMNATNLDKQMLQTVGAEHALQELDQPDQPGAGHQGRQRHGRRRPGSATSGRSTARAS